MNNRSIFYRQKDDSIFICLSNPENTDDSYTTAFRLIVINSATASQSVNFPDFSELVFGISSAYPASNIVLQRGLYVSTDASVGVAGMLHNELE